MEEAAGKLSLMKDAPLQNELLLNKRFYRRINPEGMILL
jgi:hypothetical protein